MTMIVIPSWLSVIHKFIEKKKWFFIKFRKNYTNLNNILAKGTKNAENGNNTVIQVAIKVEKDPYIDLGSNISIADFMGIPLAFVLSLKLFAAIYIFQKFQKRVKKK